MDSVASLRNRFQPPAMLPSLPARSPRVRVAQPPAAALTAPGVALNSTQLGAFAQPDLRAMLTPFRYDPQVPAWLFQVVPEEIAPTCHSCTSSAVQSYAWVSQARNTAF